MRCVFGMKKRFYASVLMTALLLLHVALASISPFKLFDDIANSGFDSYIRAMDTTSINSLATNPDNRARTRLSGDVRTLSAMPVSYVPPNTETLTERFAFDTCNRLVGQKLSSKPQADMVALK